MIYPVPKLIPVHDNDSRFQVMIAGIIRPKDVEFTEGECDDCGDYYVCDIHLPSGETIYFETHFGDSNFPGGWEEFFEIVEREREVLRSRR